VSLSPDIIIPKSRLLRDILWPHVCDIF